MIAILRFLAALQLVSTGLVTSLSNLPPPGGRKGPPFKPTNNNTWIVSDVEFRHPGPALEPQVGNVGGIHFRLRRSVQEPNHQARTVTFLPVTESKAVYCIYEVLEPFVESAWRKCGGYHFEDNLPPGDESMMDELNNRLKFRLSNLKTSLSGNFQSVTLEIVNHVVPTRYIINDSGPSDLVPRLVLVYSTKMVHESTKCWLRTGNVSFGKGWEECFLEGQSPIVQKEMLTVAEFEEKYWKMDHTSSSCRNAYPYL